MEIEFVIYMYEVIKMYSINKISGPVYILKGLFRDRVSCSPDWPIILMVLKINF